MACFPLCIPSFPGYGSRQRALCAPHGGLRGLLHCSAHPSANLRCLLEVHALKHALTDARAASMLLFSGQTSLAFM